MKTVKTFTVILALLIAIAESSNAQVELLTNGAFEFSNWYSGWGVSAGGTNTWGGQGSCLNAVNGTNYVWFGDQFEATGVDNMTEGFFKL